MWKVCARCVSSYLWAALHSDGHGGLRLRHGHTDGNSRSQRLDSGGRGLYRHHLLLAQCCRSRGQRWFPLTFDVFFFFPLCHVHTVQALPTPPELCGTVEPSWVLGTSGCSAAWAAPSSVLTSLFPSVTDDGRDASTSTSNTRIVSWPDITMTCAVMRSKSSDESSAGEAACCVVPLLFL